MCFDPILTFFRLVGLVVAQRCPYLPVNDDCRRLCMDLWAFPLTKEPFHDYQQSVNHQLSFGGTGHSEGGTDATGTNDLDRFSLLDFTCEF